jgi:hypothetical protein
MSPQVREQISPLCREEIDKVKSFRLRFEQGGCGRQEMNVSVRAYPSLGPQICNSLDFQI